MGTQCVLGGYSQLWDMATPPEEKLKQNIFTTKLSGQFHYIIYCNNNM